MHTTSSVSSRRHPESWLTAALGALLLLAPWALGYLDEPAPAANHMLIGAAVVLASVLAAMVDRRWAWSNLAAGAYTLVAPLLFGYGSWASVMVSLMLGGWTFLEARRAVSARSWVRRW